MVYLLSLSLSLTLFISLSLSLSLSRSCLCIVFIIILFYLLFNSQVGKALLSNYVMIFCSFIRQAESFFESGEGGRQTYPKSGRVKKLFVYGGGGYCEVPKTFLLFLIVLIYLITCFHKSEVGDTCFSFRFSICLFKKKRLLRSKVASPFPMIYPVYDLASGS